MVISVLNFLKTAQLVRLVRRALGLAEAPAARHQPALAPDAAPAPALKQATPVEAPVQPHPALPARPASFTEHVFQFDDTAYAYRLYLPGTADSGTLPPPTLPVVVLLHGCQQDAADFAQGTAMNELAEQKKCIVLYPEQLSKSNSMRCWNWFETAHQARQTGEPGMIAALTRQVIERHNADPARVYIAGLSAGGAMAVLVARLYPELFAALGVHSGVPTGAARDVLSALRAMRVGARRGAPADEKDGAIPTIVFHGSADKTVHPDNGDQIADAALAALGATGLALEKIQRTEESRDDPDSRRSALRTVYSAADGTSWVEHWSVESGPHAWSGGSTAGSFTDPQGPGASLAMLEFFLQHRQ
ncbi:MAG: extracellular catalytic domain type 1 short-chain-length polyhydroxyalkanoate depolymerase [Polaromonas sp.]